jgi:alanine racemase
MDQFMVNTGLQKIPVGEEVVILGQQGNQSLSAEKMATELGTIPYEILTGLNHRIPRVYHPLLKNRLSL